MTNPLRINAAWIFLVLGLGSVAVIGVKAFIDHPDVYSAGGLVILAFCGGAIFKLAHHKTVSNK